MFPSRRIRGLVGSVAGPTTWRVGEMLYRLNSGRYRSITFKQRDVEAPLSSASRALAWLRANELESGGIRVHSQHGNAYPEVTGYLIPTLLEYGDRELAKRLVQWLVGVQRADGSYTDADAGASYVFDTAQALRGLLAGRGLVPQAMEAAERAAEYLSSQIVNGGLGGFSLSYGGTIPESVQLYALPPLIQAAEVLNRTEYRNRARRSLDYYCSQDDALQSATLTHFLAYELEALVDLGEMDRATPVLDKLREIQSLDGSVRGIGGASWICTPGLAQLAACWYKIGAWESADKALGWIEAHQRPSGGFRGSYGAGASYFPNAELSWAAKFYLDAHLLRVKSYFDRNTHIFPDSIEMHDGRVQAILSVMNSSDQILEVGCGKGRFLRAIQQAYPDIACTGVDISPSLLSHVPDGIHTLHGSLESIPCADDSYDVVFSVEAIEHSANRDAAIGEMIRVARPGGWVLVIDKQEAHWGRLNCPPWERWPRTSELRELLSRGCDHVSVKQVSYDGRDVSDGLMVVWQGQKRSRLSGSEWNTVLISAASQQALVDRIRHNRFSDWGQAVLLATSHGDRVLEIGSGTGEISLQLALAGRKVTVVDISTDSLGFTKRCADAIGVSVNTVEADALQSLPFADNAFDCTWSSGLLEHFTIGERRSMLREWGRITAGKVIVLVPNASSVAYQAGKKMQEARGQWRYGLEIPLDTLRDDYAAAGLRVSSEFSVGAPHALNFLPHDHPLRRSLAAWYEGLSSEELQRANQGYLLVTIGSKH